MTDFETKAGVVISQLRADRDRLQDALDKIKAEIEAYQSDAFYPDDVMINKKMVLEIIDRFKVVADIDHICYTCKHYLPDEHDGSCGSYICKNYNGWEDKEGDKGMKNEFLNMTDYELSEYLRLYARGRKGELADLCYAASIRIAVLSVGENRESKECGTSN